MNQDTDLGIDFCFIGLGNPGLKYRNTRHNVGFMIIDSIALYLQAGEFSSAENFLYSIVHYREIKICLMKPVTYMNLSGEAVKTFLSQAALPLDRMLIIIDDLNIPFGTIRLRRSGSDGGQKGIASVIYELNNDSFPRLRFGIGNNELSESAGDLPDFVLSEFDDEERQELNKLIEISRDAALSYFMDGPEMAMSRFNRNYLAEKDDVI